MPGSDHGDTSLRCLFEDADIRGETVHLDEAYREILSIHEYAPGVNRLLGEFLAAAVLLSTNLKYEGKLILQVRSEGQIPLLMVECDHKLQVRAIARGAQEATSDNNAQLLTNGQLAITIDPSNGQRYQGIVPLVEDSLAHSLDAYFEQSEQLKSRLWLGHEEQGTDSCQGPRTGSAPRACCSSSCHHRSRKTTPSACNNGNMPAPWRPRSATKSCCS